jgi:hypothetical protein
MTRPTSHRSPPKPRPQPIDGWGLPLYWVGTPPRHPEDEDRMEGRGSGPYRQRARRSK